MKEVSSTAQNPASCFDDFPLEILSEVASNLDFVDVLSLQQTSKKLRQSTEAHVVWLALAKKYSARHFHRYRPDTGLIDNIGTSELRAWIRKRLVIDIIWRARRMKQHFRMIQGRGATVFKLVPGGRWLLIGYKDGTVHYYDLDSKNLKRFPLTPSPNIVERTVEGVKELEVHVDENTPRLEFKLVVRGVDNISDMENINAGHFYLWQVKLEAGGNSLAAERLNVIPCGLGFNDSLALGQHLLASGRSFFGRPHWIEVIWWEQCSATRDVRICFIIEESRADSIHVIGDDKILCIHREGEIRLYTPPVPNPTTGDNAVSQARSGYSHLEPIWSHSLSGGKPIYSSPVCYDGTVYRLVVSTGDGIWGLVLPTRKDNNISVVKLSGVSEHWVKCAPGFCKAYAFHNEDGTGVRIGYNWDDENGIPMIRYGEQESTSPSQHHQAFDEETGRFVYLTDSEIIVVDPLP